MPTQSEQEKEVNMKKTEENENLEDKDDDTAGADEPLACSFAAHFCLPPHGKMERLRPREGRDPHHPAQRYPTRR